MLILTIFMCYNSYAVDSFQQEGGEQSEPIRNTIFFCYGNCSCTLHMQMVGQKITTVSLNENPGANTSGVFL